MVAMCLPQIYSMFSNERPLGEIKRKVKSRLALGKNARNIIIDLAAMCFNERNVTTTINDTRSTLTNSVDFD